MHHQENLDQCDDSTVNSLCECHRGIFNGKISSGHDLFVTFAIGKKFFCLGSVMFQHKIEKQVLIISQKIKTVEANQSPLLHLSVGKHKSLFCFRRKNMEKSSLKL